MRKAKMITLLMALILAAGMNLRAAAQESTAPDETAAETAQMQGKSGKPSGTGTSMVIDDWEYTVGKNEIVLTRYIGTATKIFIDGQATVDGATYQVVLEGSHSYPATFPGSTTDITINAGVKAAENISELFTGCSSLVNLDISGLDTSETEDMSGLFYGCKSVEILDLSTMDTSSVRTMENMFN